MSPATVHTSLVAYLSAVDGRVPVVQSTGRSGCGRDLSGRPSRPAVGHQEVTCCAQCAGVCAETTG